MKVREMPDKKRDTTRDPIHRVFHLLHVIGTFGGRWFTLAELVERAKLPQTTCYHYLTAFIEEGVIEKSKITQPKTTQSSETLAVMYRHKRG